MTREEAKKELSQLEKVNTFGWTIDELADINSYKTYLERIVKGGK